MLKTSAWVGIVPFICNLTTSSTRIVNGQEVESRTVNYVALVGGLALFFFAGYSLRMLVDTARNHYPKRIAIALIFVALGVVQFLRGIGELG